MEARLMKTPQPTITTKDLILRPFRDDDAAAVARNCADKRIAMMTRTIPHPYTIDDARGFLTNSKGKWESGDSAVFAVCVTQPDGSASEPIGACGMMVDKIDVRAELGYCYEPSTWGRGYATQAAAAVVEVGFSILGLRKITAHYLPHNPASGRVLIKLGFVQEGVLRRQAHKWGESFDLIAAGLLKEEWEQRKSRGE